MAPQSYKPLLLTFKSGKTVNYKTQPFSLLCETKQIKQAKEFVDWDDSQVQVLHVTQTEYDWMIKKKEEEEQRRKEEELEKAKGKGKATKAKATKAEVKEQPPQPKPGEQANIRIED